jgi:hypothetical protein
MNCPDLLSVSVSGFELFGGLKSHKILPATRPCLVEFLDFRGSNWSGILSRLKAIDGSNVPGKGAVDVTSGSSGNSSMKSKRELVQLLDVNKCPGLVDADRLQGEERVTNTIHNQS